MPSKEKSSVFFLKITVIYFAVFASCYFLFQNASYFYDIIFVLTVLPLVLVAVEHDKLIDKNIFLRYFLLTIAVAAISWGIASLDPERDAMLVVVGGRMAFSFLILQKLFRNIFVRFMKREPEFRGSGYHLADMSYTFLLTIGTFVLSLFELLM